MNINLCETTLTSMGSIFHDEIDKLSLCDMFHCEVASFPPLSVKSNELIMRSWVESNDIRFTRWQTKKWQSLSKGSLRRVIPFRVDNSLTWYREIN